MGLKIDKVVVEVMDVKSEPLYYDAKDRTLTEHSEGVKWDLGVDPYFG